MNVLKQRDGMLDVILTRRELGWFGQALNECCGGFGVKDFVGTIGVGEDVVRAMLDQISPMYHAPIGHEG